MPQGVFERTFAVFLAVVAAGLIALLVPSWQRYQDRLRGVDGGAASVAAPTGAATTAPAAEEATTIEPPPPPSTTTEPVPSPVARPVRLMVAATRGDCWLEVRAGSVAGRVLYSGFLSQGDSRPFQARRLWVRLAASGNVDLRLNGKPVSGVPLGTVVLLVGGKGFNVLGNA